MRPRLLVFLIATLATLASAQSRDSHKTPALPEAQRAAVESSVRDFLQTVAHDITEQGPTAWQKHFADDPAFFMANDGRLAFPNTQAAAEGIQAFAKTIQHIDLHWGDDLRVDVLTANFAIVAASWSEIQVDTTGHRVNENGFFTGLAENRAGRWQFRDAHWSSIPPAKTP
jgi:hypothetical protein